MNQLIVLLLSLSLGGSLLALLVLGMKLCLKGRLPSAFFYYAWLLVLLRMALPLPGLISLESRQQAAPADGGYTAAEPVSGGEPGAPRPVSAVGWDGLTFPTDPELFYAPDEAGSAESGAAPEDPAETAQLASGAGLNTEGLIRLVSGPGFWLCLWALGAVLTLGRYIFGYLRFSRALRRTLCRAGLFERAVYRQAGGSRRLALRRSCAVGTPMLLGLIRPVLVLPEREYSEDMLRNIFMHELTHYRRGDLIFKWFAVLVSAIHWFNPLVHIVRRQLDRDCEMSCDERLLRGMDRQGKQSYGETLLSLAAGKTLPRQLVATTFATEKRNLKERLEQIMKYKHISKAGLALMLAAALLLGGCAAAVGPQSSAEPEATPAASPSPSPTADQSAELTPTPQPEALTVSTVDELLAAIGPHTSITLLEGVYDLSQAADYGSAASGASYSWEPVFEMDGKDAFELKISGVSGLTLMAEGEVTIAAAPRFANVLSFESCAGLCLSGLTIGHTEAPGECTGGVVKLTGVNSAVISQCKLFGCGTVGVNAVNSTGLRVVDSEIYDCSYYAAQLSGCQDVLLDNCQIHDNENFGGLFEINSSDNCAVINCRINDNTSGLLLSSSYGPKVYFAGNIIEDNDFSKQGVFYMDGAPVTVEGCQFSNNQGEWYFAGYNGSSSLRVVDAAGNGLEGDQLAAMEHQEVTDWQAELSEPVSVSAAEDGFIHVSTVDEFLAALAPNASIYLEDGEFDLSAASNYGGYGGNYYSWQDTYVDGPQLVIFGVDNLTISGGGTDKASILATPRYAEVLKFENCSNIKLSGFTAGHTQAPGTCAGGVLYFSSSSQISIDGCSLFGCGVWGISTYDCDGLDVKNTEIYECSSGDLYLIESRNISVEGCDIHDNGPDRVVIDCSNASIDGEPLVSF